MLKMMTSLTACNCDRRGTVDDGICDSRSDTTQGLEAGRCHCKENVDGMKCDRCKAGFWNYSEANPLGCQGNCNSSLVCYKFLSLQQ